MDVWFYREMLLNAAMLVSASILFGYVYEKFQEKKLLMSILIGLIAGLVGILLFSAARFRQDILIDARTILVSTTGMFFGFVPVSIAVFIISTVRFLIGGAGALPGIFMILVAAVFGLLWRHLRYRYIAKESKLIYLDFYLFGVITHIGMIACMFILPREMVFDVIKSTWLLIMMAYPLGTLLICMVMLTLMRKIRTEAALQESELRLRTLYEQAPVGISIENENEVIYTNTMYEKILGRTKEEVNREGWEKCTYPEDRDVIRKNLYNMRAGLQDRDERDLRFYKQDGSLIWVHVIASRLEINDKKSNDFIIMFQDITEMVKVKESLEKGLQSYRELYLEYKNKQALMLSLLNATPDMIFYKDVNGVYQGCNKAFERYTGIKEQDLIGMFDYQVFKKDDLQSIKEADEWVKREKRPHKIERILIDSIGEKRLFEVLKTLYYDEYENMLGLVGICRDITERKKREEEILYLNYHDALTGVYNRAYFEEERRRLDEKAHLPVSVILADVDGLKLINDAFGHAEGDALLVRIANIIKYCCRENDIITRMGGDEFCIFLPYTDIQSAREVSECIENAVNAYSGEPQGFHYTSISLGCAAKTNDRQSLSETIKTAEDYMYRRKFLARKGLHSTIMTYIRTTLYEKSNETEEHGVRMAAMAKKLGEKLGLQKHDLDLLELAANLHDIGKISIDLSILKKPGKLTKKEENEVRKHPEAGYRIALSVPELRPIADIILYHHERWDGKGYPEGLSADNIPLLSRIIALVDSYDAMTEQRGYQKAKPKEEAIAEIVRSAGTHFDPMVASVFVKDVLECNK